MHLVALTIASINYAQAFIWLTINDQNVSRYSTSDSARNAITILCHQQTNSNNVSTWIYRRRAISKLITTGPTSLPIPGGDVWNDTYEWPENGGPKLYADRRRSTFSSRFQTSQHYWATGYTIIAPKTSDSGVYRCRGVTAFRSQRTREESATVTLDVTRDAGPTTLMTVNENDGSVIEIARFSRQEIRCHTFIPDAQATVLYHRVYKAQNITQRNVDGEVSTAMTEWQKIYEFNQSVFDNVADNRQISNQDLTSGFDLSSPDYSDTGLYFCSAVYTISDSGQLSVNSSIVFLDARGNAVAILLVAPVGYTIYDKLCNYGFDDTLVNVYICNSLEHDNLIAICYYQSFDFIPEIQLEIGNGSTQIHDQTVYESEDFSKGFTGPFRAMKFDGVISKIFYASDICSFPEVTCSAAFPGSPDRIRRRTTILMSDYCENQNQQYLKSQGQMLDIATSMLFMCLTATVVTQYIIMDRS